MTIVRTVEQFRDVYEQYLEYYEALGDDVSRLRSISSQREQLKQLFENLSSQKGRRALTASELTQLFQCLAISNSNPNSVIGEDPFKKTYEFLYQANQQMGSNPNDYFDLFVDMYSLESSRNSGAISIFRELMQGIGFSGSEEPLFDVIARASNELGREEVQKLCFLARQLSALSEEQVINLSGIVRQLLQRGSLLEELNELITLSAQLKKISNAFVLQGLCQVIDGQRVQDILNVMPVSSGFLEQGQEYARLSAFRDNIRHFFSEHPLVCDYLMVNEGKHRMFRLGDEAFNSTFLRDSELSRGDAEDIRRHFNRLTQQEVPIRLQLFSLFNIVDGYVQYLENQGGLARVNKGGETEERIRVASIVRDNLQGMLLNCPRANSVALAIPGIRGLAACCVDAPKKTDSKLSAIVEATQSILLQVLEVLEKLSGFSELGSVRSIISGLFAAATTHTASFHSGVFEKKPTTLIQEYFLSIQSGLSGSSTTISDPNLRLAVMEVFLGVYTRYSDSDKHRAALKNTMNLINEWRNPGLNSSERADVMDRLMSNLRDGAGLPPADKIGVFYGALLNTVSQIYSSAADSSQDATPQSPTNHG